MQMLKNIFFWHRTQHCRVATSSVAIQQWHHPHSGTWSYIKTNTPHMALQI